jgi:hypothetical protein
MPMSYTDRFQSTDELASHLSEFVPTLADEQLKLKYAGFLSANAVTVYELAIKDIFIEFAEKKNKIFGTFVENYFSRINGQINIENIRNHTKRFGEKYSKKFDSELKNRKKILLRKYNDDIQSVYSNLITYRHQFIHENNYTMTFNEVVKNYRTGKEIINILNNAMNI